METRMHSLFTSQNLALSSALGRFTMCLHYLNTQSFNSTHMTWLLSHKLLHLNNTWFNIVHSRDQNWYITSHYTMCHSNRIHPSLTQATICVVIYRCPLCYWWWVSCPMFDGKSKGTHVLNQNLLLVSTPLLLSYSSSCTQEFPYLLYIDFNSTRRGITPLVLKNKQPSL